MFVVNPKCSRLMIPICRFKRTDVNKTSRDCIARLYQNKLTIELYQPSNVFQIISSQKQPFVFTINLTSGIKQVMQLNYVECDDLGVQSQTSLVKVKSLLSGLHFKPAATFL